MTMRDTRMWLVAITAAAMLIATAARGQPAAKAKAPLLLAGFERPEEIARWTGLKCEPTTTHVSEGKSAMAFALPRWQQGANEWPAVYFSWENGRGYSIKDWLPYWGIALDAWVAGDATCPLRLELRSIAGRNGPAVAATVVANQDNHIMIPLQDFGETLNRANVEQIVLYATRPESEYTVTIDNLRLVPEPQAPLAEFDLVYPNYRELIFPHVREVRVSATVRAADYGLRADSLALKLSAVGGKVRASKRTPLTRDAATVSLSVAKLPAGGVRLTAAVVNAANGKELGTREWKLRKLTQTQAKSFKVYIDEHNNTIVDGKPFFPLGWYGSTNPDQLTELMDSPFNCLLAYGTDRQPKQTMLDFLDRMKPTGFKLIYCMNDVYPTATYLRETGWEGIHGNENIAPAVVKAYRDHPSVIAWYLNDELPKALIPKLEGYYQMVRDLDPNRPCYIVLCNMPEVKYFPSTTDVMGVDPYPIPGDPALVSRWMDTANNAVHSHKPVWAVLQAFAWYQYRSSNKDRGHIPTEEELKTGRAPTYEEERCMTYFALAHGAKGIIYYCYYDLRLLPQYQEMWGWMKKMAAEVRALSPVLLSSDELGSVPCAPADIAIHTRLLRHQGRLYLIAVNPKQTACTANFTLPNKLPKQVTAMFEDRSLKTDGALLIDQFKPLEAHVYDLGRSAR